MVRILLLLAVLTAVNSGAFAFTYNNDYQNINGLNKAEYALFGRTNPALSPRARLDLTEQKLFGTTQPGTFNERVNFINKVISNSQNDPFYSANINRRVKTNRIKNVLNNVLNGAVTGYTPYMPVGTANQQFYYHNTKIPQPMNGYGNFITQTRILFND